MTQKFRLYKIISIAGIVSSLLFSLLNISFHADISLLAFPLSIIYTAVTGYFVFYKNVLKTDGKYFSASVRLLELIPYVLLIAFIMRRAGTYAAPFVIDVLQVFLWIILTVCVVICSKLTNTKHIEILTKDWAVKPVIKKYTGFGRVIFEIFDTIDALVWAIFTVLLIQIFLFQLYEIPSESMVPAFLVKDSIVVSKFDCGPKFPLTQVGLPDFRKYKAGDTIVLRNPHYKLDRKSDVKTVTSQLIYMLTFMQVNLNREENGELKADPLVKRIVAVPGEQLVMQDGTLYVRTKDHDFEPSKSDEKYAAWDLSATRKSVLNKIEEFPLSQVEPKYKGIRSNKELQRYKYRINTDEVINSASEQYQKLLDFEEKRRNYDLSVAEFQAKELVKKMNKICGSKSLSGKFEQKDLVEYNLFNNIDEITSRIISQNGGYEWFKDFMLSWIENKNTEKDIYSESNFKLNVMTKIAFGNIAVRIAELSESNISVQLWSSDTVIKENFSLAEDLTWYIQRLLDLRNMPVFPENDENGNPQFIPKNCYFMMGDNRFNSLDLRHSNDQFIKSLSDYDKNSVEYYSFMAPQYINKKYIIGKPLYRFLPGTRRGRV